MAREIVVDGVTYVPKESPPGDIKICVLDRGFVYVGRLERTGDEIVIRGARSLIRWGTNAHLGQLVGGPTVTTKLGDPCTVRATVDQLKHTVEVDADVWSKHIS